MPQNDHAPSPPAPWDPADDWVARAIGCDPCRTHSVAETARAIGVSPSTVRVAVNNGDLAAVRPASAPRLIRIRPEDAEAWIGASLTGGGR